MLGSNPESSSLHALGQRRYSVVSKIALNDTATYCSYCGEPTSSNLNRASDFGCGVHDLATIYPVSSRKHCC